MKKILLFLAFIATLSINAQTDFGVSANYVNNSVVDSESGSGFNIGAFVDLSISDSFSIQPELVYTGSTIEDLTYNLFNVNALAKYNVSEDFSLLAGPQFGFASGDVADALDAALGDDFTSLNFQLAIGASYNFNESIFVQARYAFQLNDHIKDSALGEAQVNSLSVGLGYRF